MTCGPVGLDALVDARARAGATATSSRRPRLLAAPTRAGAKDVTFGRGVEQRCHTRASPWRASTQRRVGAPQLVATLLFEHA